MSQTPKLHHGFTIVELLVYVSIVTIALTIFSIFVVDVIKDSSRSKTTKEVQQNAQLIMDRLTGDIQHAQAITSVGTNSVSLTNSIGVAVTYALANQIVTYQQGVAIAVPISNNQVRVTTLNFSGSDPTITINLTVQQKNPNASAAGQYSTTLTSTVARRQAIY